MRDTGPKTSSVIRRMPALENVTLSRSTASVAAYDRVAKRCAPGHAAAIGSGRPNMPKNESLATGPSARRTAISG